VAFAGTFHVDETTADLELAHAQASAGRLPDRIPGELYCHTLTDRSILGPALDDAGWHSLTYFGVHTPARLFAGDDRAAVTTTAVTRALIGLDQYLAEPWADRLAIDANGRPCIEVKSPLDIEDELAMPGGHIFHGDLQWPWQAEADPASAEDQAVAWGVATSVRNVLLCGAGARRGQRDRRSQRGDGPAGVGETPVTRQKSEPSSHRDGPDIGSTCHRSRRPVPPAGQKSRKPVRRTLSTRWRDDFCPAGGTQQQR